MIQKKYDIYILYKMSGNGKNGAKENDTNSEMNVFPLAKKISEQLTKHKFNVFLPHLDEDSADNIYRRDLEVLESCRLMIFLHDNDASDGRGVEAQFCVQNKIPITIFSSNINSLSPMIRGMPVISEQIIYTQQNVDLQINNLVTLVQSMLG